MRWLSCYCFRIVYNLLLVSALERAYAHNSRRGENSANHDNQFDAALFWPPRRNRIKNCKKIVSLAGGALNETNPTTTLWQPQLPAGVVRYQTTKILWYIPLAICVFSFWSFKWTSLWFHIIVQWASSNTWIPITDEEVNLQTNVVVRRTLYVLSTFASKRHVFFHPHLTCVIGNSLRLKWSMVQVCLNLLICWSHSTLLVNCSLLVKLFSDYINIAPLCVTCEFDNI